MDARKPHLVTLIGALSLAGACQARVGDSSLNASHRAVSVATNVPRVSTELWTGLARTPEMATTPYGHKVAISCHNCYASTLAATEAKIGAAITDGADLVELDLRQHSDGVTYVMHDEVAPPPGTPTLADVLAFTALRNADRPLFIEFKETTPDDAFVRGVLDALVAHGYGVPSRPVFLRAFVNVNENLLIARRLLATSSYAGLGPNVRLSVLLRQGDGAELGTLRDLVRTAKDQGLHMVELEYRTRNLFGALGYAKSLGLATGLYTIPVSLGEIFVASARDDLDEITVEYPIAKARKVASDKNGLVYFNTTAQPATGTTFGWFRGAATSAYTSPINEPSAPAAFAGGLEDALFGTSLAFASSESRRAVLYDADNVEDAGYLVATAVKFDSLAIAEGETKVIVGKGATGGFSLELSRTPGASAVLRFGVHVNGAFTYATYPVASLNITDSFFVTGVYDGNGAVRMTIDNADADVTASGAIRGGVTRNDAPVLVGAGATAHSFFEGKVQMLSIQQWSAH